MARSHSALVILSLRFNKMQQFNPFNEGPALPVLCIFPLKGLLILNPPSTGVMLSVLLCMISVFHPHRFILSRSWMLRCKEEPAFPLLFIPQLPHSFPSLHYMLGPVNPPIYGRQQHIPGCSAAFGHFCTLLLSHQCSRQLTSTLYAMETQRQA